MALEALPEVLDELGYPRANRGRLCYWFDFPESAPDHDRTEFCLDFADGRPGYLTVRVPTSLSDADTKAEIKRQLHEYGVVPAYSTCVPLNSRSSHSDFWGKRDSFGARATFKANPYRP